MITTVPQLLFFKSYIAMRPIQFQKQLRLQEARRLLFMKSTPLGHKECYLASLIREDFPF
ncbi:hypothetical protein B0W20_01300 [Bacillus spizizenii]|nr:hypothetical protein B0W20_01300 [Bacillus spizizenii]